ncbi:hypothetical protein BDP81DRAFT_431634 [Colletotrichum phormii]|uniref:Uncharacterized protein n=1 Tax=Colletotrichum phormii TaxID=359342 RepID=A0AAI9ZMA7_9PEZI|nr:uncharacterized protein BDP81DRAFT_431634 [Colletotrichum phormii]KAK1634617.1 hypothetical protein BDP81DRAFT_431634 [Colletotrichum phormii]
MSRCPHFRYGTEPGVGLIIWVSRKRNEDERVAEERQRDTVGLALAWRTGWAQSVD